MIWSAYRLTRIKAGSFRLVSGEIDRRERHGDICEHGRGHRFGQLRYTVCCCRNACLRQEILAYPSPGGNPRHRKRDFDAYGDLQGFTKAKAEPALVFTIPDKPSELDDGLLEASEVAETQAQCGLRSFCLPATRRRARPGEGEGHYRERIPVGGRSAAFSVSCMLTLAHPTVNSMMGNVLFRSHPYPETSKSSGPKRPDTFMCVP